MLCSASAAVVIDGLQAPVNPGVPAFVADGVWLAQDEFLHRSVAPKQVVLRGLAPREAQTAALARSARREPRRALTMAGVMRSGQRLSRLSCAVADRSPQSRLAGNRGGCWPRRHQRAESRS